MLNTELVREHIESRGHDFIVDVRYRPSDDVILLYVPQESVVEKAKKGFTSVRQLEFIKKKIQVKFGKTAQIIITQSEDHFELEGGVYQLLNRKYDDKVVSLYLSFAGERRVNVWIEVVGLKEELREDIEGHLRSILSEADISVSAISWILSRNELPTLASLLREVKIYQPISLNELLELLHGSYDSISDKWLNRKLDHLRKKGFLRREKNGCYVLTAAAIASVPAGARYTSSDIERALALGKKKW